MRKILIAEEDASSQRLLNRTLQGWGYNVTATANGAEAFRLLQQTDAPRIALLNWKMPLLNGAEVSAQIRACKNLAYTYIILLTGNASSNFATEGFAAGADDFICKPYDYEELLARIKVGERIINLEQALAAKVAELKAALAQVNQLTELLPICMFCKKIRDDNDYWQQVEVFFHKKTGTDFSHGICPECLQDWRHQYKVAPHMPLKL